MTRPFIHTTERTLEHEELREGLLLPKGTRVSESDNHALSYWWPAQDLVVDGITVLAGTQLDPPRNGHLRGLWTVKGQRFGDLVIEENGLWATFHESGRLQTLSFKNPTRVRGLLVQFHVEFHDAPGAPIEKLNLVEDTVLDGTPLPRGPVHFDVTGHVTYVRKPSRPRP